MKRAFDLGTSFAGLLVLSPVIALIAVAIRISDGGPILFRQIRVGQHDSRFEILKFRTMSVEHGGPSVTRHADPRVTRIGKVLRQSKLDELPQLLNVVRGEMSLVGPRPEVPELAMHWGDARKTILSVRPGITDPASIHFRDESAQYPRNVDPQIYYIENILPIKVEMYLEYIDRRSLSLDFKLILSTLKSVMAK